MKKLLLSFLAFSFTAYLFLHQTPFLAPAFAESTDDLTTQLQNKQEEIQKLEAQLANTRNQAKTLKSQLNLIDGQAKVTALKIEETNLKVEKLKREINDLSTRIERIGTTLDRLSEILLERIIQTYKYSNTVSTIELLFSSHGFADLLERLKYIQVIQTYDKKKLYELQATKLAYNDQKQDKQTRQTEAEKLNKDLEIYKAQLDQQKKQKEELLNVTKNDETKFQARLREIQKEISEIQRAVGVLISTEPRRVGKGEPIGIMGNTGYSFGAHLHFGVYNISSLSQYNYYSNYENPGSALRSINIGWWESPGCNDSNGSYVQKEVGTGSWDWPMDTNSLRISQGFGDTCYSGRLYGGRPHPAYDMFNNSNLIVKSVEEGQAYFCRNCTGDGGNGVFIFHPNGKMTLYWHLQ